MALSRLGDYIEAVDVRNADSLFGVSQLRGISINKVLTPTKANTDNLDLSNYKVVKNSWFTYCVVTSRNGNKISLAYNDEEDCIVSSINPVFKIKDEKRLLPRYLMMFFNRSEFDRYARFNSWGSARETFSWDDFCDIVLEIPSIEIQRKYVAIYEGLLANLHSYEKGLDDLKLVCDGYIEKLKKISHLEKVGNYIEQYKQINSAKTVTKLAGLIGGEIMDARKSSGQDNLAKFQIIYPNTIVYPPPHFGEIGTIGIVKKEPVLMSPMYIAFKAKNDSIINMDYLLMWFRRSQFQRFAFFQSCSSIRDTFDFDLLCEYKLPIPSYKTQCSIVGVFDSYNKRQGLINSIRLITSNICPVLIRGSIEESREALCNGKII